MGKLRCPICRSRQWRKEPSSGMLVCSEGHILQSYRNETNELTDMVGHVLRQRRIGNAKPRASRQRANPAIYHGTRARLLYFQSLQLLLRLQVSALQKLWELPSEFEIICRDVWVLYLTMLSEQLHVESTFDLGRDTYAGESQPSEQFEVPLTDPEVKDLSDSDQALRSSDDEKAEIDIQPQNDLAELLDGISDASSDSGSGEEEFEPPHGEAKPVSRDSKNAKARENQAASKHSPPSCTVAILVVACWMIRLPVLYMDLLNLINNYSLPYLNIIARGLIPPSMIFHMSPALIHSLSTEVPPRPLQLHALSSRITRKLKETYKIETPEANAAHFLSRAIEALHLPAVFYHMTKIFADMLRISLTLHPSLSAPAINASGKSLAVQKGDNIPVEMAFICTAIMLLKLIYGMDGRPRRSRLREEFLPGLPPQEEFLSRLRRDDESALNIETRTALELSPTEIDQYLDFCTRALLGNNTRSRDTLLERTFQLPNQIIDVNPFSWPTTSPSESDETTDEPRAASAESEPLNRGNKYTIFNTTDVLGDLPADYRLVVSQAARWCGVGEDDIAYIVERFERRLLRDLERGTKPNAAK